MFNKLIKMEQDDLKHIHQESEILDLQAEIERLKKNEQTHQKELAISNFKLEKTLKDTSAANNILKEAFDQLEQQKLQLSKQSADLQLANEEIITMNEELNTNNEALKSSLEYLYLKQNELAISNLKLEKTIEDTSLANNILKDALEQLEQQKLQLGKQSSDLQLANEEINTMNEELNANNEMLNSSFNYLNLRQKELERKDKNIQASIAYARLIQTAILPIQSSIAAHIKDFFVFYRPKDVVSGDFYWFYPIEDNNLDTNKITNDRYILISADCTGHGVPGAFMSLIGDSLLRTIVMGKKNYSPARILDQMHKGITKALHQKDTRIGDGMDISVVLVDKKAKTLSFAGAHNSLYFIKHKGESASILQEIRADKMPVGGMNIENRPCFSEHILDISTPTTFYLFSDGFQDQFGGPENKKIMKKRFKEMLNTIAPLAMQDQQNHVSNIFDEWKGNNSQTDDVLVLGVRAS